MNNCLYKPVDIKDGAVYFRTEAYQGYTGTFSETEDEDFCGTLDIESGLVGFYSETLRGVQKAFEDSVDDYLHTCALLRYVPEKPKTNK